MAKVSVREISRVTGFSPATVSNALNGKRSVSEETARIIREAAQNMGLSAECAARRHHVRACAEERQDCR